MTATVIAIVGTCRLLSVVVCGVLGLAWWRLHSHTHLYTRRPLRTRSTAGHPRLLHRVPGHTLTRTSRPSPLVVPWTHTLARMGITFKYGWAQAFKCMDCPSVHDWSAAIPHTHTTLMRAHARSHSHSNGPHAALSRFSSSPSPLAPTTTRHPGAPRTPKNRPPVQEPVSTAAASEAAETDTCGRNPLMPWARLGRSRAP